MSGTLLISDLHLSHNTKSFNCTIREKLPRWSVEYDALYLLGDIFDAWLGDDIIENYAIEIIDAFQSFSKQKPLYFMHGNRDFLIGNHFLELSGATLLPDPYLAKIYGQYYILSHGDLLCTDDVQYQKFRAKTRSIEWQNNILTKPKWYRKILTKIIRSFSSFKGKQAQQKIISDVTMLGIQELKKHFSEYPEIDIIHGHTHKPKIHIHSFHLDHNSYTFNRYVLPDWRPNMCGGIIINQNNRVSYINFQ
ncbi:MAG: UDP-2,3-diacylglucosamine diphosphatase [Neisseriaceae bacterium]|nr:MAG: UDP-2,3-diacylglucosamine diphosphatase [Neisseriaceae bacterium]